MQYGSIWTALDLAYVQNGQIGPRILRQNVQESYYSRDQRGGFSKMVGGWCGQFYRCKRVMQTAGNELRHDKTNKVTVHPPSLIRVFAVRMKKAWVLSYPLSAQRRLIRLGRCPGWSESLLGAQSLCWFCHVAAQILFWYVAEKIKEIPFISTIGYEYNILWVNEVPQQEQRAGNLIYIQKTGGAECLISIPWIAQQAPYPLWACGIYILMGFDCSCYWPDFGLLYSELLSELSISSARDRIFAFEPPQNKTNKMACVLSEDSDQPGHPTSLISLRCALSG